MTFPNIIIILKLFLIKVIFFFAVICCSLYRRGARIIVKQIFITNPVIRRCSVTTCIDNWVFPHIVIRVRFSTLDRSDEPRMFVTCVVWHKVQYYFYTFKSIKLIILLVRTPTVDTNHKRTSLVECIPQPVKVCHGTE